MGLNSLDIQKEKMLFTYNGLKMDLKDKTKLEKVFINGNSPAVYVINL